MFTIQAPIKQINPIVTGVGKVSNQAWQKLDVVVSLNPDTSYPKDLCVSFWNADLIDTVSKMKPGAILHATCEVTSREYNGKFFTEVKAYKLESAPQQVPAARPANVSQPISAAAMAEAEEALPF